jgi:hypothetical protein
MAMQIQAGIHAVDLETKFLKTSWSVGKKHESSVTTMKLEHSLKKKYILFNTYQ